MRKLPCEFCGKEMSVVMISSHRCKEEEMFNAAPQDSGRTGEQIIPAPIGPVGAAPQRPHWPPLDYSKQQANATQKEYDEALRDAKRYRTLRRMAIQHIDEADDYGYAAEEFDSDCDKQAEWFAKFDAGTLNVCPK